MLAIWTIAIAFARSAAAGDEIYGAPAPEPEASAEVSGEHPEQRRRPPRGEGDFGVEPFVAWYPHAPSLLLQGSGAPRDLVGLRVPAASTYGGLGVDFRGYGFPTPGSVMTLIGFRYAHATHDSSSVLVANGAPVDVAGLSTNIFEIAIPWWNGFAFSDARNRWRLGMMINFGAAFAWGSGQATTPRGVSTVSMHTFDFFIRPEADACVRAQLHVWACAHVTENLLEFGLANGGSAGLRIDVR